MLRTYVYLKWNSQKKSHTILALLHLSNPEEQQGQILEISVHFDEYWQQG
jgi:hypothetical protein